MELDVSPCNLYKVDKLIDDGLVKQLQPVTGTVQGVVPIEENYQVSPNKSPALGLHGSKEATPVELIEASIDVGVAVEDEAAPSLPFSWRVISL